jgi:hypothetical protein
MADEEKTDDTQETQVGRTAQETQVGARTIASPEGEQSPADAQRSAEGRPEEPLGSAATTPAATAGQDTPEGTGPGGSVRGGYGVGATGPEGGRDVRGPSDTGSAGGGQSPMDAQRRADESTDAFADKPHLYVAGAFVGGLIFAQILKRLGGDDD